VELSETPANEDLLTFLRSRAQPGKGGPYDLDGWELHTHPDLVERLEEICGSRKRVKPAYGVVMVEVKEVALAVAMGTSVLLFRLPEAPEGVKLGPPVEPLTSRGWFSVNPWQSQLPSGEGLARLSALLQLAHEHTYWIASAGRAG
jgi:hypothetical protein